MKITNPELKVVRFANEDVIATSLYYAPASFFGGNEGDTAQFTGSIVGYDDEAKGWLIPSDSISNVTFGKAQDRDYLIQAVANPNGSVYFEDYGVPVPSSVIINIIGAANTRDTYEYNGNLYTKGANYYELYGNQ